MQVAYGMEHRQAMLMQNGAWPKNMGNIQGADKMTVRNEQKLAFRDMTKEERSEIVEAWIRGDCQRLDVCELGGDWWIEVPNVIADCYVYRTRPRQLVIPWEVIRPEYKWAAMDFDKTIAIFKQKPYMDADDWAGGSCAVVGGIFNINTTGIDWRDSLTERPEGV